MGLLQIQIECCEIEELMMTPTFAALAKKISKRKFGSRSIYSIEHGDHEGVKTHAG